MIAKEDIFKEILTPEKFDTLLENADNLAECLSQSYKINYMLLRLILDVRFNTMQIAQGRALKHKERSRGEDFKNPVIKDTDKLGGKYE